MAANFSLFVKIAAVDKITSTLAKITGTTSAFGAKLKAVGRAATFGISLPLAAFGTLATRTALNYEDSFSQVRAITGKTDRELKNVKDSVIAIGKAADLGPTKVAAAFRRLVSGGFALDAAQEALPHVTQLAKAVGVEAEVAAGMIDDLGDSFHLGTGSALELADAIARARIVGETDAFTFVDDLKTVAPIAHAAGQSLTRDVIPAMAALRRAGVENAAIALRSGLSFLADKGATDAGGNLRSLVDIIGDLEKRSITGTQAVAIFGARAGPAMAELLRVGSAGLKGAAADMLGYEGAAGQASLAQDGMKGSLAKLSAQWESFQVQVAEGELIPMLGKLVGLLSRALGWFTSLSPAIQETFLIVAGAAVVFGPLLTALASVLALGTAIGLTPIGLLLWGGAAALAGLTALTLSNSSPRATETVAAETFVSDGSRARAQQAQITVDFRNAPAGTKVTTSGDADIDANLGHRLEGGR